MATTLKPKVFGPIFVTFDGNGEIHYSLHDLSSLKAYPPVDSPVDTLVAALGACLVKSLQWVADQRKVKLNPFNVRLIGTKSLDQPGRVARVEVTITDNLVDDRKLLPRIVKQAKAICTVSNTLNCDVSIETRQSLSS